MDFPRWQKAHWANLMLKDRQTRKRDQGRSFKKLLERMNKWPNILATWKWWWWANYHLFYKNVIYKKYNCIPPPHYISHFSNFRLTKLYLSCVSNTVFSFLTRKQYPKSIWTEKHCVIILVLRGLYVGGWIIRAIKMNFREIHCEDVDWNNLAQDEVQCHFSNIFVLRKSVKYLN